MKICGMLRRLLSSDRKEKRHYKVKSARTSFEKNNSTRRQENVMLSIVTAYELRSEEKILAILKHELIPVTLSFAEIMNYNMRTGHKSLLADFLTEKAKCPESITIYGNAGLFIDG